MSQFYSVTKTPLRSKKIKYVFLQRKDVVSKVVGAEGVLWVDELKQTTADCGGLIKTSDPVIGSTIL